MKDHRLGDEKDLPGSDGMLHAMVDKIRGYHQAMCGTAEKLEVRPSLDMAE